MILYSVSVSSATLSTTNDVLTLTGGATRSIILWEIDFTGMATASAANEVVIFGVTTAGVTPTAITPAPVNAASPASSFTAASSWSTFPVVNTVRYHNIPVNANGSRYFWRAANVFDGIPIPGGANNTAQRSFRSVSGTSVVSGRVRVIEV